MTIDELISSIEVEKDYAEKREQKARAEIQLILDTASQESRSNLSAEEDTRTDDLFGIIEEAKAQQEGIKSKLARAQKVKAEELDSDRRAKEVHPSGGANLPRQSEQRWHVTREERTYTKESDPTGRTFLQDVCRQFVYNDVVAGTRLARHMQEERVERHGQSLRTAGDLTTAGSGSGTGGLIVPQYLIDMTAPHIANLRPFADVCNQHPLPAEGMSVTIPKITTATSVAVQSTELADASATSMVETDLVVNVKTASGRQNVSRQAIDRGTGVEDVVLQDLFAQYATNLDKQLILDTTTGLYDVAIGVAYTDSSPTAAEMYPHIMEAAAAVESALLARGQPSHVIMHSRRWYWLASEMTDTWPFINSPNIPDKVGGVNTDVGYAQGVRGYLPNGLSVVVDNNVPIVCTGGAKTGGTEDTIFVVPARECHLWESPGAPAYVRAEQPLAANLGVQLVVYGYFAYTFGRYANAMQNIEGTGLVAPVYA